MRRGFRRSEASRVRRGGFILALMGVTSLTAMTRVFTPTEQELVRIASNPMDRLADPIEPEGLSAVKTKGEETF